MMCSNDNFIVLESIWKYYGYTTALKDIDLTINKGSFVTIFGSNGAGKSTLLKLLSMQTKASKGKIRYSGIFINKLKDNFRSKFGVISHQSFLYENLSALENLEFYGSLYNISEPKKRALKLLKKVDLYSRKDDLVRTFSRGMLQRVSIARALVHEPDIIFLDEPYTGLDNVAADSLTLLLKEQLTNNKTILMVTHDLRVGLELATHILIMRKGQIVFNKEKSELDISSFEELYINYAGRDGVNI